VGAVPLIFGCSHRFSNWTKKLTLFETKMKQFGVKLLGINARLRGMNPSGGIYEKTTSPNKQIQSHPHCGPLMRIALREARIQ